MKPSLLSLRIKFMERAWFLFCLYMLVPQVSEARQVRKIAFVGNSYTEFHQAHQGKIVVLNDLPELVSQMLPRHAGRVTPYIYWGKPLLEILSSDLQKQIIDHKFDFLILQEGRYAAKMSLEKIRSNYQRILKKFEDAGIEVIYLIRVGSAFTERDKQVFLMEEALCLETSHCHLVDPGAHSLSLTVSQLLGKDGFHPRPILTWLNAVKISEYLAEDSYDCCSEGISRTLKIWNLNQVKYGSETDQEALLSSENLERLAKQAWDGKSPPSSSSLERKLMGSRSEGWIFKIFDEPPVTSRFFSMEIPPAGPRFEGLGQDRLGGFKRSRGWIGKSSFFASRCR